MASGPANRLPIVTYVIVALNVLAFGIEVALGADPMAPNAAQILALGGNFGPITFDGESWRLLTSMFLHFGLTHLAVNMFGLVIAGRPVELVYGRAAFASLYLFAGLVGSLVSAIAARAVSAGASGAIFGIFGAWGAFLVSHRDRMDRELWAQQTRSLLVLLAINVVFGLSVPGIDLRAHLGGLAGGFVAGLLLTPGKQYVPRVIVVLLGCGLVFALAQVAPRFTPAA